MPARSAVRALVAGTLLVGACGGTTGDASTPAAPACDASSPAPIDATLDTSLADLADSASAPPWPDAAPADDGAADGTSEIDGALDTHAPPAPDSAAVDAADAGAPACRTPPDPGAGCGLGLCVPAARMLVPHVGPQVATLHDGRVIVLGGSPYPSFVEIYSPSCDRWDAAAPSGLRHGAFPSSAPPIVLDDGRVFALGDGQYEIYDPVADVWSAQRRVPIAGFEATLNTRLADGRLMVANTYRCPVAVYEPKTDLWTAIGYEGFPKDCSVAALSTLRDGSTLMITADLAPSDGGTIAMPLAFLFDPTTSSWSSLAPPPFGQLDDMTTPPVLPLDDGRAVAFFLDGSALFDPTTRVWARDDVRAGHWGTATELPCGKVMFLGDYDLVLPGMRFVWDPIAHTATSMPIGRPTMEGRAAMLSDGRLLYLGGQTGPSAGAHARVSTEVCR